MQEQYQLVCDLYIFPVAVSDSWNSNTDLGDTNAQNEAVKSSSTQEYQIYKVHLMWAMFTGAIVVLL